MLIRLVKTKSIRTVLAAVLILAAVEVFVRTDYFYELSAESQAQEPIEIFEFGFSLISDPEFIVLGNSLTRNAISSFETTRLTGADHHFLLNLSQSGATMSDQLWLYQRYRDRIKRAGTLLIGIDYRSFDDASSIETGTTPRFRRYASMTQRLGVNDWSERISLLAGTVWKTWDGRQQIRGYLGDMSRLNFSNRDKPPVDELGRFAVRQPDSSTDLEDIIAYTPLSYTYDRGVQFEAFTELIRLARADSLQIILLDVPASEEYLGQLERNIGDEIRKLYRQIEQETGMDIVQIALTEADCPQIEDCFVDYGHMNVNGSKIYTRLLLERLGIPCLSEHVLGAATD